MSGRVRKRSEWIQDFHNDLCTEFERFRSCGVKLNTTLLLMLARMLIEESNSDTYGPTHTDPRSGKSIAKHLEKNWVERFMHANSIVSGEQKGKLTLSDEKCR